MDPLIFWFYILMIPVDNKVILCFLYYFTFFLVGKQEYWNSWLNHICWRNRILNKHLHTPTKMQAAMVKFTKSVRFNVVTIERTTKQGVVHARASPWEVANFEVLSLLKLMLNLYSFLLYGHCFSVIRIWIASSGLSTAHLETFSSKGSDHFHCYNFHTPIARTHTHMHSYLYT